LAPLGWVDNFTKYTFWVWVAGAIWFSFFLFKESILDDRSDKTENTVVETIQVLADFFRVGFCKMRPTGIMIVIIKSVRNSWKFVKTVIRYNYIHVV
jgi:hypothetical protein